MDIGGCFLVAMGMLILFLSGSCTLFVFQSGTKIHSLQDVLILAACGGLPMALGAFLIFLGLRTSNDPSDMSG